MDSIKKLQSRLNKVENELEKVRGCSPLSHGWQTQKYAKASRKWDVLAIEKMKLIQLIEEIKQ
jgi:predicted secreted hydrolase